MEILSEIWAGILWLMEMALHIDVHLRELTNSYGHWIYLILFIIVFCETGLVITPFLPGDSLLFAGGTLVGAGMLGYFPLVGTLLAAAIIGDAVNFHIGKFVGPPVFDKNYRLLKREYLESAQTFYGKHGGKAIILARFIPIIRTFVPFIAGVASMDPRRFLFFNIIGALIWVLGIVTAGYVLGGLSIVQENFSIIIYLIILISVMPVIISGLKHYFAKRREPNAGGQMQKDRKAGSSRP